MCKNAAQVFFLLSLKYKYYNVLIINILKSMRAENDSINHSLNQIFRWIFCRREGIKKSSEPKINFFGAFSNRQNDYLCKDTEDNRTAGSIMDHRRLTRLADVIAMSPEGAKKEGLSFFKEGLWVLHAQFGTGVIVKLEEQCAMVQFDAGIKRFFLNSDKLSPLDINDVFFYQGFQYRRQADADELELVGVANPSASKAVIPDHLHINGKDYPITAIGEMAFANMKRLTDVTIPVTVVKIAPLAFVGSEHIGQIRSESSGREKVSFIMNELDLWGILPNPERKVPFIPCRFEEILFYPGFMDERQKIPTFYFLVRQKGLWGIISKTGGRNGGPLHL